MGGAEVSGGYQNLLGDLVALLEHGRDVVARSVNTVMTAEHWSVGHRIVEEEQAGSERAAYGTETMERLAADLTNRFGRGYSVQDLYLMRQFRLAWPLDRILQSAIRESPAPQIIESATGESAAPRVPALASLPRLDSPVWALLFPAAVDRVCASDGGQE
jgi:hypothetical protein